MTATAERSGTIEPTRRGPGRKRVVQAGGVAVVAALVASHFLGSSDPSLIQVHPGKVVKIEAQTFNCRARVSSVIPATANHTTQPIDAIGNSYVGRKIGVHFVEKKVAKTFNSAETFDGQIDTLSCIAATKEHLTKDKSGLTTITIRRQDVQYLSYPVFKPNEFTGSKGVMADVGSAEWSLVNNPIKTEIQNEEGDLVSYAAEAAINYAQQTCGRAAWSQTETAFVTAEDEIAESKLLAADPKLQSNTAQQWSALVDKTVALKFVGPPPTFTAAYTIPKDYPVTNVGLNGGACTITPNSLVQPNYVNPTTGDPANLTVGS